MLRAAETTRADVATDDRPRARRDADRTRHTCDLSKLVAVSAQSAISIEPVLHPLEPAHSCPVLLCSNRTHQARHTPCTVGSSSGRPDRPCGMYPLRVGVTMSIHKLTAGSGYDYLTRQVAALDATEKGHTGLASYFAERGETAGVWIATLETRDAKHEPRSLTEHRTTWLSEAAAVLGSAEAVASMVRTVLAPSVETATIADSHWIAHTADHIVTVMEASRSTWQMWHVRAEAQRQVRTIDKPAEHALALVDLLVDEVLDRRSIALVAPADSIEEPAALRRVDGSSVYTVAGADLFTSQSCTASPTRPKRQRRSPSEKANLRHSRSTFDHGRVYVGDMATTTEDAFNAWVSDQAAGLDAIMIAPTRHLVAQLNRSPRVRRAFAGEWIATALAASERKASTKAMYAGVARSQIVSSALGGLPLGKITPRAVEGWLVELRGKGLAESTVRISYAILLAILSTAVRDGALGRNPVAAVKRPRVTRREADY